MIKDLIKDIAYEHISLSQGLNRAKLIANRTKSESFKKWLEKELTGYLGNDSQIPKYRIIKNCTFGFMLAFPFGQQQFWPVAFDQADQSEAKLYTTYTAYGSISMIESDISMLGQSPICSIKFNPDISNLYARNLTTELAETGGVMQFAMQKFGKVQLIRIIESTKQSLLDTLMNLDNEFPDLENEFTMTHKDKEKAENIITNHIYGNNNPVNIAAGQNVQQSGNTNTFSLSDFSKLESLGVDKKDINDLEKIVEVHKNDKAVLKDKAMKWLGAVSSSVAGRGLYDKLPEIVAFVHTII